MPTIDLVDRRKTQTERLFYIEFISLFNGSIGRKDLIERFSISEPAATKDLSLYTELAPKVIQYDLKQKKYIFSDGKLLFEHNTDESLFALCGERTPTPEVIEPKRSSAYVGISIKRKVPIKIVSAITRAMHQNRTIEASYVSLSSGERKRTLTPTALVHDGLRWHIRCYDHEAGKFKDHNLARFLSVDTGIKSDVEVDQDHEWNQFYDLNLICHPRAKHPETIALDYGIKTGSRVISIRACLIGYFLRHWNIDFTDDASADPSLHQLYLSNKNKLKQTGLDPWQINWV